MSGRTRFTPPARPSALALPALFVWRMVSDPEYLAARTIVVVDERFA